MGSEARHAEIREAKVSILANLAIWLTRLVIGIIVGSMAIVADALHAMSDVLTSIGVYVAGKIASKPADKEHPYGHGRVAVLAELFISMALLLVSIFIVYEVIYGIFMIELMYELAIYGVFFLVLTGLLKELLARWAISLGKTYGSNLCIIDGLHHRLDALLTMGISAALFLGAMLRTILVDRVVALAIVAIIGFEAVKIAKKSIDTLMEKRIPEVEKIVIEEASKHNKILRIHDVNARNLGGYYIVESTIHLPHTLTLKEAHKVAHELEERVRKRNPKIVKLLVHIEPEDED